MKQKADRLTGLNHFSFSGSIRKTIRIVLIPKPNREVKPRDNPNNSIIKFVNVVISVKLTKTREPWRRAKHNSFKNPEHLMDTLSGTS